MLENVLFFIHILKIAMRARHSFFHHLSDFSCYTFVLTFNFITQQFLLVKVQGLFFSPTAGYPRYATDITLPVPDYWFLKAVQLRCNLNK